VDVLDIANVGAGYSASLGPPSWVSGPSLITGTIGQVSASGWPEQEDQRDPPAWVAGPSPDAGLAVLVGLLRSLPTQEDEAESREIEEMAAGLALSAIEALETGVVLVAGHTAVRAITWPRLQEAAAASQIYSSLIELIGAGMPEEKAAWPEALAPYYPYRRHLIVVDGVVLCGERPLVPPALRPEVLEILHAGHSGVSTMLARAGQSLFWPDLRQDVIDLRAHCQECIYWAPSNPAMPPHQPIEPDFPFSHIVMDFFQVEATYLAIADRYSNWLSIFRLAKDDSAHVIEVLRSYFSRWGVAREITNDGASVLTSVAVKDFLARWGVKQRVSSAYYPRANKRSELAVKAAKRLIMGNLGPRGTLDTDRFARALMEHRNAVDPLTGLSPAMVLFGRELKGFLPAQMAKYQPRKEWRLEADLREQAHAKRHGKMADRLASGSRKLAPLQVGDTVVVQDQSNVYKPGKWTKTGEVVEVLPFDSFMVRMHGSSRLTQRNRRFLRKIVPFASQLADRLPLAASPAVTQATRQEAGRREAEENARRAAAAAETAPALAAKQRLLVRLPRPTPLLPSGMADWSQPCTKLDAGAHRQAPAAAPGRDVITALRERELRATSASTSSAHE
jgi:hypothetical protein